MITVGIVGASGFIGKRTVEMFSQDGFEVRPIVRTEASLSRLPHLNFDCRIANAFDRPALQKAFSGCDVIVHSVLGSAGLIRGSVVPAYQAAQAAGVRRLIYLSTMCVHGQAPPPGTDESTSLTTTHEFPYNNAKIYAERKLLQLRSKGSVEVVIFRPGIVFGPNSRWVVNLADELLEGTAYLIQGGTGICNTTYVDNLVHAMKLAMTVTEADRQAFFVGELEQITWAEFYKPVAEALGISMDQVPSVEVPKFRQSLKQRILSSIWSSEFIQKTLSLIDDDLKQTLKKTRVRKKKASSTDSQVHGKAMSPTKPTVSPDMAALQQCQYKLPFQKAQQILHYEPIVSFPEASQVCINWLAAEGNPIYQAKA
jgi:nucleoside-diphosphate-sugar epimerase